jgi:hypothetical protein
MTDGASASPSVDRSLPWRVWSRICLRLRITLADLRCHSDSGMLCETQFGTLDYAFRLPASPGRSPGPCTTRADYPFAASQRENNRHRIPPWHRSLASSIEIFSSNSVASRDFHFLGQLDATASRLSDIKSRKAPRLFGLSRPILSRLRILHASDCLKLPFSSSLSF